MTNALAATSHAPNAGSLFFTAVPVLVVNKCVSALERALKGPQVSRPNLTDKWSYALHT